MVIRCKNCYKVLHHQERFCTRCGVESEEIAELMQNGEPLISEWQKAKIGIIIAFFISFLLTGFFSIVMGLFYNLFNPGSILDAAILPEALSAFSRGYSLLITGLATLITISIIFHRDWLEEFQNLNHNNYVATLLIGLMLIGTVWFLHPMFDNVSAIPSYFFQYREHNLLPIGIMASILVAYAIAEEMIFRKLLMNGLSETTIWPDWVNVAVSSLVNVFFALIIFLDFRYLPGILLISIAMGVLYLKNKENIIPNIVIRLILIVIILSTMK